jgi:hypothetical protein
MSHVSASVSPESGIDRLIVSVKSVCGAASNAKPSQGFIPVTRHGPLRNLWTSVLIEGNNDDQ